MLYFTPCRGKGIRKDAVSSLSSHPEHAPRILLWLFLFSIGVLTERNLDNVRPCWAELVAPLSMQQSAGAAHRNQSRVQVYAHWLLVLLSDMGFVLVGTSHLRNGLSKASATTVQDVTTPDSGCHFWGLFRRAELQTADGSAGNLQGALPWQPSEVYFGTRDQRESIHHLPRSSLQCPCP